VYAWIRHDNPHSARIQRSIARRGRIALPASETGREARFYSITSKGRTELAREEENWARLTEGVRRTLRYA
jgi:hypothetical protein